MKRTAKLIFLVLVAVSLFTVFAVVGYASVGEDLDSVMLVDYDFNAYEIGASRESNSKGYGYFGIAETDGSGDRYVEHYGSGKEDTGSGYVYMSDFYDYNDKYTAADYPIAAIDFDIMKPGSDYCDIKFSHYVKYASGAFSSRENTQSAAVNISSFKSYLSKNSYEWSHVTVIFTLTEEEGKNYISIYVYVNGEKAYSAPNLQSFSATEKPFENCYVTDMRFYNDASTFKAGVASAFDNIKATLYAEGSSFDAIANAVYSKDYDFPFTRKACELNGKIYDSVDEAIAAASEGDTVKLLADIASPVVVEKSVYIDRNVYDESGNKTGELYDLTYSSTSLVPEEKDGIVGFKYLQNAQVEIYWDDCPALTDDNEESDECYCPEGLNDHVMAAVDIAMLNTTPSYKGEIPKFQMVDGVKKEFVGWSYTQGGDVDEILPVTEADCEIGYISLYPVYKETFYAVEVVSAAGESSGYSEEEFITAVYQALDGSKVIIHDDIQISSAVAVCNDVTLDLNGYDLNLYMPGLYTEYPATLNADGTYTRGKQSKGLPNTYLFYFTAKGFTFNLTSSRPGSVVSCLHEYEDRWIYNGEVVKVVPQVGWGGLFNFYPSTCTVNILGENINFYTGTIAYAEHGGNGSGLSFNIDGGTFVYNGSTEGLLAIRRGGTHTVKNATFHCNGSFIFKGGSYNKGSIVNFDNCEILNASFSMGSTNDVVSFNNCRLDFVDFSKSGTVNFGKATSFAQEYSNVTIPEGLDFAVYTTEKSYTADEYVFTADSGKSYTYAKTTRNIVLGYLVIDPKTDSATVYWKDQNGKLIDTTYAVKNSVISAPAIKIPVGDGYRAVTNPIWCDEDGNPTVLNIGTDSEYVFVAKLPAAEDAQYVAYLQDVMFNMSYYAHFAYNFYLPYNENVTLTKVGNYVPDGKTVLINGKEYFVCTAAYLDSTAALKTMGVTCTYKIDEKSYSVTYQVSTALYANAIVNDPASSAIEKEAVGCLMRYVEESYKAASKDGTLSAANQAIVDDFYSRYTPADYVTKYDDAQVVDEAAVFGLIESIHWQARGGSRVSLVVTLTDAAAVAGYKVKANGIVSGTLDLIKIATARYGTLTTPSFTQAL